MKRYILALDQGTTSSRAILFDREQTLVQVAQREFTQHYPKPGWVEHDAQEILSVQLRVAREALEKALASGAGLEKLRQMIAAQGGDARVCDDTSLLPQAERKIPVRAEKAGYVVSMDAAKIGLASQRLGAGRLSKADAIDPAVGLVMNVELGDRIEAGQPLVTLYANQKGADEAEALVREGIVIDEKPAQPPKLIYAVVRPEGVERF